MYSFLEVKLHVWQSLKKTHKKYDIRDIVIESILLYLTVLINQPAGQRNRLVEYTCTCSQNVSNFFLRRLMRREFKTYFQ